MTTLALAGVAEAADVLRVSKSRVRELRRENPTFPAPVAELAAGPVWLRRDVEAWGAAWSRKVGRPRKEPAAT